jgi:hypothetical protein
MNTSDPEVDNQVGQYNDAEEEDVELRVQTNDHAVVDTFPSSNDSGINRAMLLNSSVLRSKVFKANSKMLKLYNY